MEKSRLLTPRLPTAEVKLEEGTIVVRGLSRAEAVALAGITDPEEIEIKLLTNCLVDPQLSIEEVDAWRKAAPSSEIDPVTNVILELSGLLEGSQKAAMLSFRERFGDASGIPSSEDTQDDGG